MSINTLLHHLSYPLPFTTLSSRPLSLNQNYGRVRGVLNVFGPLSPKKALRMGELQQKIRHKLGTELCLVCAWIVPCNNYLAYALAKARFLSATGRPRIKGRLVTGVMERIVKVAPVTCAASISVPLKSNLKS